jgi:hypothetical protein
MNIKNDTEYRVAFTLSSDKNDVGLLFVIKGTFTIPLIPEGKPMLSHRHIPIFTQDVLTEEENPMKLRYDADFCNFKKKCDVVLNGSAYSVTDCPVRKILCTLKIDSWQKSILVHGSRFWKSFLGFIYPTKAELFSTQKIDYDNTFTGDVRKGNLNPCSFANNIPETCDHYFDLSIPSCQYPNEKITHPLLKYTPASFGALSRTWPQRRYMGGTFDVTWAKDKSPLLPDDFDNQFNQCAPADQQIEYPKGGEIVELNNLAPVGKIVFELPSTNIVLSVALQQKLNLIACPNCDTIIIEPDERRLIMVWRYRIPDFPIKEIDDVLCSIDYGHC